MEITEEVVHIGQGPFMVQNLGPDNVYIGESSVAPNTGFELKPNETVSFGYLNNGLYGVCDENEEASVRVLFGATGIFGFTPLPEEEELEGE